MNFEELINQIDLDTEDESDDSPTSLDIKEIENNIQAYDIKKLCEMVVCERYFGLDQKISLVCMQELARRRDLGDTFNFESYIDKSYKELPVLQLGNTDLRSILGQMIVGKIK